MIRRPPRSTRTDTLFPYTTLFRSYSLEGGQAGLALRNAEMAMQGLPQGSPDWIRAQDISMVARAEVERSEEHTSELQSLMRISYAVFCLKKKNTGTSTGQGQRYSKNNESEGSTPSDIWNMRG